MCHLSFCTHPYFLPSRSCISLSLSFVALWCSIERHIKPNLEPLFPLLSASWPPVALRCLKAFKRGESRGCGDMNGGGRVEGTHNCLLREAFSPAFVHLADLSERHHACRLAPRDPLLCLPHSAFADGGPDNNSTLLCIVFR